MIFEVPRAQSLRWVNMFNYGNNPYNHDNTLLQDEEYDVLEQICYYQKFDTNDNIIVQCLTDYSNVTLKVYTALDVLAQTVTLSDQNAGLTNNVKALQGIIDTTILGGIYYAKLEATGVGLTTFIYQTEYFKIDNYLKYTKISVWGSEYSGLYYDNGAKFGCRVEASIKTVEYEENTNSFKSGNSLTVNLKTETRRKPLFETDPIPRYLYEKLTLWFAHKNVEINGIQYAGEDSESEQLPDSLFYSFKKTLVQSNYEIYDSFSTSTGGEVPTPGGAVLTSDGIKVFTTDGTKVLKPY